jgi:hypothetical protein
LIELLRDDVQRPIDEPVHLPVQVVQSVKIWLPNPKIHGSFDRKNIDIAKRSKNQTENGSSATNGPLLFAMLVVTSIVGTINYKICLQ